MRTGCQICAIVNYRYKGPPKYSQKLLVIFEKLKFALDIFKTLSCTKIEKNGG